MAQLCRISNPQTLSAICAESIKRSTFAYEKQFIHDFIEQVPTDDHDADYFSCRRKSPIAHDNMCKYKLCKYNLEVELHNI